MGLVECEHVAERADAVVDVGVLQQQLQGDGESQGVGDGGGQPEQDERQSCCRADDFVWHPGGDECGGVAARHR